MALLSNRRMVCTRCRGSVTFWAWMVSVAVHLIVLTVFGAVKFSQFKAEVRQSPVPTAKVSRIKKLTQAAQTIPKPKIKKPLPIINSGRLTKMTDKIMPANQIFDAVKPSRQNWPNLAKTSGWQSIFSPSTGEILPKGIELFGSCTDQRKVCYLVDCSGSMRGIFSRVRKELKESIRKLQPDQYFYIIFFGGDRLFEFGDGNGSPKLLRATQKSKSKACDFIDSVQPAGQTNATQAWERAVQIRDSCGVSPEVIYFLTDGFELTIEDTRLFLQKISNLLKRFAPATTVNTIGFWPTADDRRMLKTIAKQGEGEFVFITD